MSKIQQKRKPEKMTPDEVDLVNRVINGTEKIYEFANADEAIASLHKSSS